MKKFKDYIGQKFGNLTIVAEKEPQYKHKKWKIKTRRFFCKCSCGNGTTVNLSSLTTGNTKSCGCLNHRKRDILYGLKNNPISTNFIREDVDIRNLKKKRRVLIFRCMDCNKEISIFPNEVIGHSCRCRSCYTTFKQEQKYKLSGGNKECSRCKRFLDVKQFIPISKGRRLQSVCIQCNILSKYKITYEDYDNLLFSQNGVCDICKKPELRIDKRTNRPIPFCVDHDHITGKVRGLLCRKCNGGIGLLGDSVINLKNAIIYLNKNKNEKSIN